MHIYIISHGYPSRRDPQWGCFERDQAEALVKLGHKVTVFVLDKRFRLFYRKIGIQHIKDGLINAYIYHLIPFTFIPFDKLRLALTERMMHYLYNRVIDSEGEPDVIYAHYMFTMMGLRLVKETSGKPIVGIEHWSVLNKPKLSKFEYRMGKLAYSVVDKLLAVSQSLSIQIKNKFGYEPDILYNMINDDFFQAPISNTSKNNCYKIVSVGTLNKGKGFDLLIEALAQVDDKTIQLTIIGEGPERTSLENLARRTGVIDRVCFKGLKPRKEIIEEFEHSNLFVLPSRGETFGVAYVEALAMGIPVIATKCGGPESFMCEEYGKIIPVDNLPELVTAINDMQKNKDSYNPLVIRNAIRNRFSGEVIASQLENYFKVLINNEKTV